MWHYIQTDCLMHYGKGHLDGGRSGRYPWGSGKKNKDRPPSAKQQAKEMSDDELSKKVKRMKLERQYVQTKKDIDGDDNTPTPLDSAKKTVDVTGDFVRNAKRQVDDEIRRRPKVVSEDLSKMTDQQLRDKINRAALEQQYTNYYGKQQVSKGERYVSQTLEVAGSVLAVTSSALAIALAIKQLKG